MLAYLQKLKETVVVGVVGGSNLVKQKAQLGQNVVKDMDYSFSENGLVAYANGELIHNMQLKEHLKPKDLNALISHILRYIANLDLPIKRGTFVEFRTAMLNVSPIGRNCSYDERLEFNKYDEEHGIRKALVADLQANFAHLDLCYVIGGQISIDIFPKGWDKTYCLQHVRARNFREIHFFGDKTLPGQNDHEIFISEETIGHAVENPDHTMRILKELFGEL
mmetsp:Transcript_86/g.303  ORF Transcript_86/g.303 Transcript_86/m.303 type:complete len:222 (-) Transcript_86:62-727(-)